MSSLNSTYFGSNRSTLFSRTALEINKQDCVTFLGLCFTLCDVYYWVMNHLGPFTLAPLNGN